jgi:hypothetical protein
MVMSLFSFDSGLKAKGSLTYALPMDFSIPGGLRGPSVRKVFSGVYDLRAGLDIKTKSGFFFGPYLHHSLIKAGNSRNAFSSPYRSKFNMVGMGLTLGYETTGEGTAVWQFSLATGYDQGLFSGLPSDSGLSNVQINPRFVSLQPGISLRFKTVANTSFGLRLGYRYLFYSFDPFPYRFDRFIEFEANDIKPYTGFFTFGFGFTIRFGKPEGE